MLVCFLSSPLFGSMEKLDEYPAPERIKNFALSSSQELSPLVSFGQTIINKGDLQVFVNSSGYLGKSSYLTYVVPYFIYGIRDDLSFSAYVPFSPKNAVEGTHSSGILDSFTQLEYAFYAGEGSYYEDQATILTQVIFPTGTTTKNPPTGAGAMSFFLGATVDRMTYNWYFFISPAVELALSNGGTKQGNLIYYQCGIGRYIPCPQGWIFAALVEFDGQYGWKDKVNGLKNPSTGGNIIYLTPSLWFSSKRVILQFGAGYPVIQNLFGNQPKQHYSVNFSLGIKL